MKPILFNTEMVKAIMDGRKTVTRRLVKNPPNNVYAGRCALGSGLFDEATHMRVVEPPFKTGDILYVRETWRVKSASYPPGRCEIEYRAGGTATFDEIVALPTVKGEWRPSIHMPKKAARIFLRVKCVRAERLQDITVEQVAAEGIDDTVPSEDSEDLCNYCPLPDSAKGVHCYGGSVYMCAGRCCKEAMDYWEEEFIGEFAGLWESTIKDKDIGDYGWDANPWVWVIEFEKISKEEAMKC